MIRRMKQQTKRRRSVLGGRKLALLNYRRVATRLIAERLAAKVVERLAPLLTASPARP